MSEHKRSIARLSRGRQSGIDYFDLKSDAKGA